METCSSSNESDKLTTTVSAELLSGSNSTKDGDKVKSAGEKKKSGRKSSSSTKSRKSRDKKSQSSSSSSSRKKTKKSSSSSSSKTKSRSSTTTSKGDQSFQSSAVDSSSSSLPPKVEPQTPTSTTSSLNEFLQSSSQSPGSIGVPPPKSPSSSLTTASTTGSCRSLGSFRVSMSGLIESLPFDDEYYGDDLEKRQTIEDEFTISRPTIPTGINSRSSPSTVATEEITESSSSVTTARDVSSSSSLHHEQQQPQRSPLKSIFRRKRDGGKVPSPSTSIASSSNRRVSFKEEDPHLVEAFVISSNTILSGSNKEGEVDNGKDEDSDDESEQNDSEPPSPPSLLLSLQSRMNTNNTKNSMDDLESGTATTRNATSATDATVDDAVTRDDATQTSTTTIETQQQETNTTTKPDTAVDVSHASTTTATATATTATESVVTTKPPTTFSTMRLLADTAIPTIKKNDADTKATDRTSKSKTKKKVTDTTKTTAKAKPTTTSVADTTTSTTTTKPTSKNVTDAAAVTSTPNINADTATTSTTKTVEDAVPSATTEGVDMDLESGVAIPTPEAESSNVTPPEKEQGSSSKDDSTEIGFASASHSVDKDSAGTTNISSNKCWSVFWEWYDKFELLILLIVAITIGRLYPPLGADYLFPHITSYWILLPVMFFLAGAGIRLHTVGRSIRRFLFHMSVQGFNFFVDSVIAYGLTSRLIAQGLISYELAAGIVVCACMPMTITSVTHLSREAGGDPGAATVSSALGNFLGVFVAPMLMLAYVGIPSGNIIDVVLRLSLRVITPFLVGQAVHLTFDRVKKFMNSQKYYVVKFQRYAIFFVVYTTFSRTCSQPELFSSFFGLYSMIGSQVALFVVLLVLSWTTFHVAFDQDSSLRIVAVFACTQKSLPLGVPLICATFGDYDFTGLLILPLLVWYPIQLVAGCLLTPRLKSFAPADDEQSEENDGHFASGRTATNE